MRVISINRLFGSAPRLAIPAAVLRARTLSFAARACYHFATSPLSASAPASCAGAEAADEVRLPGGLNARLRQCTADQLLSQVFDEPAAAGQLLFTRGLLCDAAKKDAAAKGEELDAYLTRVGEATASFFETREQEDGLPRLVGHDDALAALRVLGTDQGKRRLMLLTGPRSVGKSLLLRKLAAELRACKRQVLIVDGRQYGADLVRGIQASIAADQALRNALYQVAPAVYDAFYASFPVSNSADRSPELPLNFWLGGFIAACRQQGKHPVLIIDEANQALVTAADDHAGRQRTFELLQLLTRASIQEGEASVVLATTEHGLASRLRSVGYNVDHITDTIVAGEVPGAAMEELLTKTWGCGPQLGRMLLLLYGGHVLHASLAVSKLVTSPDRESMRGAAALGYVIDAAVRCFQDRTLSAAGVPKEKMKSMREELLDDLRALVTDGFVPLESEEDDLAQVISLANAGFIAPLDALAPAAVPPEALNGLRPDGEPIVHVLLPTSHITRLLMASHAFVPPPDDEGNGPAK